MSEVTPTEEIGRLPEQIHRRELRAEVLDVIDAADGSIPLSDVCAAINGDVRRAVIRQCVRELAAAGEIESHKTGHGNEHQLRTPNRVVADD